MRSAGRVLVVDDDPGVLRLVRDVLQGTGYMVDAAASVGGALDLLWREWEAQPDVILLDLSLPALDGQTFAELYALLPVRHAPLVLVTAAAAREASEYAARIGAQDVLLKPFDTEALLAAVHRAARRPAANEAHRAEGHDGRPAPAG